MPPIDVAEIRRRFTFYPPRDEGERAIHEAIRADYTQLAEVVAELVPESREKSLAVTALEESLMWANAALARARGTDA